MPTGNDIVSALVDNFAKGFIKVVIVVAVSSIALWELMCWLFRHMKVGWL